VNKNREIFVNLIWAEKAELVLQTHISGFLSDVTGVEAMYQ
jgi:hypothetical protein